MEGLYPFGPFWGIQPRFLFGGWSGGMGIREGRALITDNGRCFALHRIE